MTRRAFFIIRVAIAASLAVMPLANAEDKPYAPQSQASLKPMLSIDWQKGPSLPQGLQDSAGGIVDGTLITSTGYCGGQSDVPGKPTKYPYGFIPQTWGLNLQSPQAGWEDLPDFPGTGRQMLASITVNNRLYAWGGYNYSAPFDYGDGYRLSKTPQGQWSWDSLPALPWSVLGAGIASIGSKIYVAGGADTNGDNCSQQTFTATDRNGLNARLGSKLMVLDTNNLGAGWTQLAACPGTPRNTPSVSAVGGKLYLLAGNTGQDNSSGNPCTVVDNWQYDPAANAWQRLVDMPVSSGGFPSGIVACDRYILLVGGYQFNNVLGPDGSVTPAYGTPSKHDPDEGYFSDVFVYDTQLGQFGTATPLPLNNLFPTTVVAGNQIYMMGGEAGGISVIDGEAFGHHPDLYLTGTIQAVPEPSTLGLLGAAALGLLLYGWWTRK